MELNERDINLQKEAPTLAAIGNGIPFTVPAGYFDELSASLKTRVYVESIRDNKETFSIPENYFDDLSSRITNKIASENIRTIVPTEGFTVPAAYFDELPGRIISKIGDNPAKKTTVRTLLSSWISYAAAACITVTIATGIYFSSNTYTFNQKLSEVPDEEIINYLQVYSTAGDTPFIIENLNPGELEEVNQDVSAEDLELYIQSTTL